MYPVLNTSTSLHPKAQPPFFLLGAAHGLSETAQHHTSQHRAAGSSIMLEYLKQHPQIRPMTSGLGFFAADHSAEKDNARAAYEAFLARHQDSSSSLYVCF
jgi:hypothetical protein